jgi:hypothetical protein
MRTGRNGDAFEMSKGGRVVDERERERRVDGWRWWTRRRRRKK